MRTLFNTLTIDFFNTVYWFKPYFAFEQQTFHCMLLLKILHSDVIEKQFFINAIAVNINNIT